MPSNCGLSPRRAATGRGCVKTDWKSRFYAKSTSADVAINFRFNVDTDTSVLAKSFYTLGPRADGGPTGAHVYPLSLSKGVCIASRKLINTRSRRFSSGYRLDGEGKHENRLQWHGEYGPYRYLTDELLLIVIVSNNS
ncbi:hypothetical protein [Pseudomonas synxantha]|nr:hypothetical protein [Pseudomonas synxantha]